MYRIRFKIAQMNSPISHPGIHLVLGGGGVQPEKSLDLLSPGEQNFVLSELATRLVTYLSGK